MKKTCPLPVNFLLTTLHCNASYFTDAKMTAVRLYASVITKNGYDYYKPKISIYCPLLSLILSVFYKGEY